MPDGRRDIAYRQTDITALRAIAQAAINVELFTVPLYMVSLYSIAGMHQITAKGTDFYANRLWPGAATVADPQTANEKAFNLIFSVWIEEMLHVQLAANIASAIGMTPIFTSPAIQDKYHGWTCYGPQQTVIPHIIDLVDTAHNNVTVTLRAIDAQQIELFQTIEESAIIARRNINPFAIGKYFPTVPFTEWTSTKTETDLPMFGTIDHMYQCYYDYLTLTYTDGTTLFDHVFIPDSPQKDMFNEEVSGHPKREYNFRTVVTARTSASALAQILTMINAITDQGEGSILDVRVDKREDIDDVIAAYEASPSALEADYPYYTDTGSTAPSADTTARSAHASQDHYARFGQLRALLDEMVTWPQWHATHGPWTAADFQTRNVIDNPYHQPSPAQIAQAYNRMAAPGARGPAYAVVSRAAVGSIAGVTTVLDQYWSRPGVVFPYPAMTGSGDRVATCWALFGQPPDLAIGAQELSVDVLSHGCQALDLSAPGASCAPLANYHSCRGSNICAARGGCGFVHPAGKASPGAACGFALVKAKTTGASDDTFSAPSNNRCATLGGCAVPISAAQILPQDGTMELVDFDPHGEPDVFGTMAFGEGELVHDVAYRAYQAIMAHRGLTAPSVLPPPSDIRLVFPPST